MSKFKVGDKVRICNSDSGNYGESGKISTFCTDGKVLIDSIPFGSFYEEEIEHSLPTPAEQWQKEAEDRRSTVMKQYAEDMNVAELRYPNEGDWFCQYLREGLAEGIAIERDKNEYKLAAIQIEADNMADVLVRSKSLEEGERKEVMTEVILFLRKITHVDGADYRKKIELFALQQRDRELQGILNKEADNLKDFMSSNPKFYIRTTEGKNKLFGIEKRLRSLTSLPPTDKTEQL